MTRILVISDTHYYRRRQKVDLSEIILDDDGKVAYDGIIHCGDLEESDFLEELNSYGISVFAVLGNNYDYFLERELPRRRIVEIDGYRIGVVHGNGNSGSAIENARREFMTDNVDLVLFGHSHVACIEKKGCISYMNPGSLSGSRSGPESYGIVNIKEGRLELNIVRID